MAEREPRLDLLRGAAMLTIAINHVHGLAKAAGYNGLPIPTFTKVGFSSAAEIFIFLSGYLVGLIYSQKKNYPGLLFKRSVKIYAYNLFLFALLIPFAFSAPSSVLEDMGLTLVRTDIGLATLQFMLGMYQPGLLNVLQFYVVMMLLSIPFIWLIRFSPWLALFVVCSVYFVAQILIIFGYKSNFDFWIPTWQILFFLPMIAGFYKVHVYAFHFVRNRYSLLILACLFLAFSAFVVVLPIFTDLRPLVIEKYQMPPLRILHFVCVLYVYAFVLDILLSRWPSALVNLLATVGKETLGGYVVSVLATCYGVLFIFIPIGNYYGYGLTVAAVLMSVIGFSLFSARRSLNKYFRTTISD